MDPTLFGPGVFLPAPDLPRLGATVALTVLAVLAAAVVLTLLFPPLSRADARAIDEAEAVLAGVASRQPSHEPAAPLAPWQEEQRLLASGLSGKQVAALIVLRRAIQSGTLSEDYRGQDTQLGLAR